MTAYVFAGPSLPHADIRALCDVVCLPPAAQGDVYRAAQNRPRAIGIIDGYFEGMPSPWHKEILWAMSEGIHVFGSASMGALRAAELCDFGMRGVGRIFEAYRDEALLDDDEVAVLHGPAETGYIALSEAMVNIRATLEAAEEHEVIGASTRATLAQLAKGLFYQERSWKMLLDRAAARDIAERERTALQDWLPDNRVDLKGEDARAMLAAMQTSLAENPGPKTVDYVFEWTDMWDAATTFAPAVGPGTADHASALRPERVLEELRLHPERYQRARREALLRMLALKESDRYRLVAGDDSLGRTLTKFRTEMGLFNRTDIDRWLTDNDLRPESFEGLLKEETRLDALWFQLEPALDSFVFAYLRRSGQYAPLAERSARKQRVLNARGFDDLRPGGTGPNPAELLAWYFEGRLARSIPEDIDRFSRESGFAHTSDFYRELSREYLYLSSNVDDNADDVPKSGD